MIENYRFQNKFGKAKIFISGFWILFLLGSLTVVQFYFKSYHNKNTYFFIVYIMLVYIYGLVFNILKITNLYTRVKILDNNLLMVIALVNEISAVFSFVWVGFGYHVWGDKLFYGVFVMTLLSLLTCITYFVLSFLSKKKVPISLIKIKFMFFGAIPYYAIFIVNIALFVIFAWYPPTLIFIITPFVLMYPLVLLINKYYK